MQASSPPPLPTTPLRLARLGGRGDCLPTRDTEGSLLSRLPGPCSQKCFLLQLGTSHEPAPGVPGRHEEAPPTAKAQCHPAAIGAPSGWLRLR